MAQISIYVLIWNRLITRITPHSKNTPWKMIFGCSFLGGIADDFTCSICWCFCGFFYNYIHENVKFFGFNCNHSKKTTALTIYRSQHRFKAESQHLKFLLRLQVQSLFLSTRPSAFQWRRHTQSDVPVLVEVAPHQLLRFCPSSWQHWRCCCCPGRPAVPRRTALSRSWWRATIL